MQQQKIQRVVVIGAGLSGVVSAAHLLRAGFQVTVFERNKEAGGVWIHSSESAIEPPYPCMRPAEAELQGSDDRNGAERRRLLHAPPGPCYDNLRNNIDTPLMQVTLRSWPEGTPRVVSHPVIKCYIQETCEEVGVNAVTIYGALVSHVWKQGSQWHVRWASLGGNVNTSTFDAVVVASGHYHAPRIPDIPGLASTKSKYPDRITHSKYFRNSTGYKGKNVLLIGGGVSSTDIAKDISSSAQAIYQSTRNGKSDMSASALPKNATRVSQVAAIALESPSESTPDEPSFIVHLKSGYSISGIDRIIICTGYQFTLPFLPQFNDDQVEPDMAGDHVLITDGGQVHNLHQDIFYIPDPTLTFVGIPLFTTIFTLFEFQAMAVVAFYEGVVQLPSQAAMRREYQDRVMKKGVGRYLHSLKEEEEPYVNRLVEWVNAGRSKHGLALMEGHTATWKLEMQLIREAILKLRAAKAREENAEKGTEKVASEVNGAQLEQVLRQEQRAA